MSRSRHHSPVFPIVGSLDYSEKEARSRLNRKARHLSKRRVAAGEEPMLAREIPYDEHYDLHGDGSMRWLHGVKPNDKIMRK